MKIIAWICEYLRNDFAITTRILILHKTSGESHEFWKRLKAKGFFCRIRKTIGIAYISSAVG
jgi:hypothetical protein